MTRLGVSIKAARYLQEITFEELVERMAASEAYAACWHLPRNERQKCMEEKYEEKLPEVRARLEELRALHPEALKGLVRQLFKAELVAA